MSNSEDKIVTLADLQKDFERERRNRGETVIKPKNGGETYALNDKSYKSSPDFFRQLWKPCGIIIIKPESIGSGQVDP